MIRLSFLLVVSCFLIANSSNAQDNKPVHEINWMSFEEAMEASVKEPKKWFIDMYTDWCGWCKRMDATTFKDSTIIKYMNDNYYAVKFDAEQKEDIIIGDSTYSFVPSGRRGYHMLAAQLMGGKMSYPTYVFLNDARQILTTVPGYKTREDLLPILQFCAGYDPQSNPTDYQTFMQSYKSPFKE